MSRSNFPNSVDSLPELSNILTSDQANVDRYKTLIMQANRTSAEDTELNNLKTTLATKLVDAEYFNFLSDAITAVQDYFLNKVMSDIQKTDVGTLRTDLGYPSKLQTSDKSSLVNAVNEVKTQSTNNGKDISTVNTNIGSLQNLATLKKDTIVNAINEVNNDTDSHIGNYTNPHNTTATQVGAYSKSETDGLLNGKVSSNLGTRIETVGGFFFTNGMSTSAQTNVSFSKAFSKVPTVVPANILQAVAYGDVIYHPYIFNVTTLGFSCKISSTGNLGTATPTNLIMDFFVVGT